MLKSKNHKKGDGKMEHKDLWLVLGLTVIIAIAVSISTVSLTGDVIFSKSPNVVQKSSVTEKAAHSPVPKIPLSIQKFPKLPYIKWFNFGNYNYWDIKSEKIVLGSISKNVLTISDETEGTGNQIIYTENDKYNSKIYIVIDKTKVIFYGKELGSTKIVEYSNLPYNENVLYLVGRIYNTTDNNVKQSFKKWIYLEINKVIDGSQSPSLWRLSIHDGDQNQFTNQLKFLVKPINGQINYLGKGPLGTANAKDVVLYTSGSSGSVNDITIDADITLQDGTIIQSPKKGIEQNNIILMIPK